MNALPHLPIRWRLTVLYTFLLAAFLLALDLFAYAALRQSLLHDQQTILRTSGRALTVMLKGGADPHSATLAQSLPPGIGYQIYDSQGALVARSPGPKEQFPPMLALPRLVGKNPEIWATVYQNGPAGQEPWMVLTVRLGGPREPDKQSASGSAAGSAGSPAPLSGILRVATSLGPTDQTLGDLARILIGGSIGAVALALLIGPAVARGAVQPLRKMAATADRIAAGDLSQRTALTYGRDEVGDLARALDFMAARLEQSSAVQRATEERLRRFAADASHELRTPLTALRGYAEVLLRGAKDDPDDAQGALEAIHREALRMEQLTSDLLDLTRLDEGLTGARTPVRLDEVAKELVHDLSGDGPLVRSLADRPVTVLADRAALVRAVGNLIENALRYTPRGETVTVTVGRDGAMAVVRVADTGHGIPPGDLPHLFERFYRGDTARSRATGGFGLGLSIVRGIVEAHDGTVEAESQLGRGSTFTIRLPAVDDASDDGAARPPAQAVSLVV